MHLNFVTDAIFSITQYSCCRPAFYDAVFMSFVMIVSAEDCLSSAGWQKLRL